MSGSTRPPQLSDRLGASALVDLADCAHVSHRAVGSPHFDAHGEPLSFDPLITLVHGELTDARLPHATMIISPCEPRPILSVNADLRRLISATAPDEHPSLRADLEGRIERGTVKRVDPGALLSQTDQLVLAQISTVEPQVETRSFEQIATTIREAPYGSTIRIRLPLDASLDSESLFDADQEGRSLERFLDVMTPALTHDWPRRQPRRLILVSRDPERARHALLMLIKRSVRLSLIDRLTEAQLHPRIAYGVATLPGEELVTPYELGSMVTHLNAALESLVHGSRAHALEAAEQLLDRVETGEEREAGALSRGHADFMRSQVYLFISSLLERPEGVREVLIAGLTRSIARGAISEASTLAQSLIASGLDLSATSFAREIISCARRYEIAECQALLFREEYTRARDVLAMSRLRQDSSDEDSELTASYMTRREVSDTFSLLFEQLLALPWRNTPKGAPLHEIERSLTRLKELTDSPLVDSSCSITLQSLRDWIDTLASRGPLTSRGGVRARQWRRELEEVIGRLDLTMRQELSGPLSALVCPHYDLSVARARFSREGVNLKPEVTLEIWRRLSSCLQTFEAANLERHAALGYLTLITLSRGKRALTNAQVLLALWCQMIERELDEGVYGELSLDLADGSNRVSGASNRVSGALGVQVADGSNRVSGVLGVQVVHAPISSPAARSARRHLALWRDHASHLSELARGLEYDEFSAETAHARYELALHPLEQLEQEHLLSTHHKRLGKAWLGLFVGQRKAPLKASLGAFMGEAIVEVMTLLWRFARRWRFFYRMRGGELQEKLTETLETIERTLEE